MLKPGSGDVSTSSDPQSSALAAWFGEAPALRVGAGTSARRGALELEEEEAAPEAEASWASCRVWARRCPTGEAALGTGARRTTLSGPAACGGKTIGGDAPGLCLVKQKAMLRCCTPKTKETTELREESSTLIF